MSDKPKGLAARLNKNKPVSAVPAPPQPVLTQTSDPVPEPVVPVYAPPRNLGAWSKGIETIRSAVSLPPPVVEKPVAILTKKQAVAKSNKDPLGYITDEDEGEGEDEDGFY
jgi:hypothetical protein